ncbi:MAG: hypothetical protein ACOY5F_18905 [Pseudomonadota bacterium]
MERLPFFSTAKAFNEASKESDWGYELRHVDGVWTLYDRDGNFKMSCPQELWAAAFATVAIEMDRRAAE